AAAGGEVHPDSAAVEAGVTPSGRARRTADSLKRNIQEFGGALRSFMHQAKVPLVLCFCPRTPAAEADAELKVTLHEAEETLISVAGRIANVHIISSASLLGRYPV